MAEIPEHDLPSFPTEPNLLTTCQQQVALLLAQGLSYAQVAERLNLSIYTVHEHVRHIYERIGSHQRESLILWLVRAGLLK